MENVHKVLDLLVWKLSDQNYTQSLACYRSWFIIGQAYYQPPSDQVFDNIWENRVAKCSINPRQGCLIHSTAHLTLRFATDAESDRVLAPHSSGLRNRLGARSLLKFFDNNLLIIWSKESGQNGGDAFELCVDANFIAHWANLGHVEEAAIRHRILQSLISYPEFYDHQADALIILFKLAGATFEAYADPSVVDRCFELLKEHYNHNEIKGELVQEITALRESGWEGLPPPPVFRTEGPNQTGTDQNDPTATPIIASPGLPSGDPEPRIPLVVEQPITPDIDTTLGSPVTQSPSFSTASLSDFTIADASDEESLIDPATLFFHDKFYFEDGNVEVLCGGDTLFRVHTSILLLHSPVLRGMFAKANLATAASPNGIPRIPSSDSVNDFVTLLKVIYLPEFPGRNKVPDFTTFSSLLNVATEYKMPAVRSRVLDVVRDAYPEKFEGLISSKVVGENVFSEPTPHPNEVLDLFIRQGFTSALPMAYYMAVRGGGDSLMGERLPTNARLSPRILQVAVKGLIAFRELELEEAHRLVYGLKGSHSCSSPGCASEGLGGPQAQRVVDLIVDSTSPGRVLFGIPLFRVVYGGEFCGSCLERWEVGYASMRKKIWDMLPNMFGLEG